MKMIIEQLRALEALWRDLCMEPATVNPNSLEISCDFIIDWINENPSIYNFLGALMKLAAKK
jgi:hypothetical protein